MKTYLKHILETYTWNILVNKVTTCTYHHLQCWCPKKSRVSGIFSSKSTQKINSRSTVDVPKFPQNFVSVWWPVKNPSEISESFEKISTANQINSKSTEQSANSTFFGTSTLQMVIYVSFPLSYICNYIKYDNSFYFILLNMEL